MFGNGVRELIVAWPGITIPISRGNFQRNSQRILVPVASPQSPHKNFNFIRDVARALNGNWHLVVTAPDGLVDLGEEATTISFMGLLTREQLFEEYRRATVCLIGSTHETVGLPIFEALAAGTPVVAFDAPYVRAFRDHFGISHGLILATTPWDAAAGIKAISRDPARNITVANDFRQAEWAKILNKI